MPSVIDTEVCVVGGGPAGSAIARKLALLGHQVCLIEKAAFPRSQIGESFPPSILRVLDLLGVREQVEAAGFLRPTHSLTRWSSADIQRQPHAGAAGFQVDRGRFDQLLLAAAQAAGVQVLQPASAARPVSQGRFAWTIPVRSGSDSTIVKARFLVEAVGKHHALRPRPQRPAVATLALYGYWRTTRFQGSESRVEAGTDEWFWGAPLPDGRFNAAVFLDAKRFAAESGPCEQLYRQLLAKTALFSDCLDGTLETPVQIRDASFYLDEAPIAQDWITVGDAACAIDPLSSQGVQMAMMSAFQGAIAVHTLLTEPEHTAAAIAFYRNKLQETVARSQKTVAEIYAAQSVHPATPFWQQRSPQPPSPRAIEWAAPPSLFEISDPIRLSKFATFEPTPVIQGDAIRFINALHHPRLESPVAYLGNLAIVPLLNELVAGQTILELIQQWSNQHDLSTCWQVLQWLWFQQIIVLNAESSDEQITRTDVFHA